MSYNLPLTNVVGMTSLKVENLANNVSSTTLKHVFEDYGPVSDIHIPQNPLTNEPYGFAFISFHNKCDAESAMNALNGILLYGCKLRVQMVHSDSQYAQPSCGQEGQYHNKEDSHEFQSHCERHSCHTTRIQSRYHSRSFPDQSESQSQSHRSHKRLPSTKRSKSKSSTSTHQLQDKPHARKRNPPGAKRKKHKSRSSHKQDFKCSKAGGENIKNKERTTEITDSELLFVRPHQSEESRSETITAHPHTTAAMTIGNPYPQKKSAFDENEEDPFYDIDNYQPTVFQQYVDTTEEQIECQFWTGESLNKSQVHNFMKENSNDDDSEDPDLKHDHLYFAKLLGEQHMKKNQKEMKNEQSESMFKRPSRSEANANDTFMAVPSTRSQTRKRHRNPPYWREGSWIEREQEENNQRQIEYPQSDSMFKKAGVSEEDEHEMSMVYNRFQGRTRRRTPGLPKDNDWIRCGAKASDVVSTGDSERGHFTSFQQSEKKTKSKKVEFRAWTTNNDDISGGMGFTFNNENSNLLNDHALLSGLSCHDSNRDEQKQVDHQQLESTCVFPFLTEENVPENLIEDPFTSDRNIRSESLEFVIADEITESRPPQPIQHLSPETFSHLTMPDPLSSVRPVLPLRDDFNISEFQRRYFSTTSPTRKHTEHTAHVDQSTFVRATNIFPVQINTKEHTDISLHSNWENVQNSEIISVAQTSNTDLNFTVATASDETSKQIMTEIFEGERVNSIEIDLEACDSSSSQNSRRVYSEDCSIPRSVSNSVSHSTSNVSTNHSCISSSRSSQQSLPIPNFMDNTIIMNRFLPVLFQISDDSNEPILLVDDPSTALQETRVTNQEYNDSDSWPSLPDFSNFNDIHNNHPKGLTKEQIKTLPTRNFCENDELNACSICITEYIESSKIRILPCSHEYHVECIDHWLYENASCPICRCKIINPDDREIFF